LVSAKPILQLLNNKPEEERWAVLVNEFGEIGIDGGLFSGQHTEQSGVFIREVPGGCMCCTAGLPMRVALVQLLRRAKPDRLLIEPTGLGHPKEVLQTLNDSDFRDVLEIKNILTLVDARHLSDIRYFEHETFLQQIAIADVIVANKQDQYTDDDKTALKAYLNNSIHDEVKLVFTEQGVIEPSLLESANSSSNSEPDSGGIKFEIEIGDYQSQSGLSDRQVEVPLPESGYIKAINKGEDFNSIGWRFSSRFEFDQHSLFAFLSGLDTVRLKATFITNTGCFAYNATQGALSETEFEHLEESRIEIIAHKLKSSWEADLFECLRNNDLTTELNKSA